MKSRTGDMTHDNLCMWIVSAAWRPLSESAKSASRSASSLKFYLRTTVAWPLCLRHNILTNEQGTFHNNANIREK